jgi:hypothetical protein
MGRVGITEAQEGRVVDGRRAGRTRSAPRSVVKESGRRKRWVRQPAAEGVRPPGCFQITEPAGLAPCALRPVEGRKARRSARSSYGAAAAA